MGTCTSKPKRGYYAWESNPRLFIQKMKVLQQEINAILKQQQEESEVYERELMMFALREAEWKRERKKLKEEVTRLQKNLEEKEERIRRMEVGKFEKLDEYDQSLDITIAADTSLLLVEHMREERARRDETVEKWKMLYLAIKHELDDLIQKTHEGTIYWRAEEEDLMEDLQREVKAKEETIEVLKAQLASMEEEDYKSKREVDILRQSLRIMSTHYSKGSSSSTHPKNHSKLKKFAFVNNNEH